MTPMPWFRFYSEAVRDTKLRRIARKTDRPFAETVGTWAIILSFASESPQRGQLLLSDGNPVDPDDISDVAGCNADETLQQLQSNGMITVTDGIICVSAWNKRQYESDNSTPRVNKFRDKRRNVAETLHERYSNADVTPPDTDTDTDTEVRVGKPTRKRGQKKCPKNFIVEPEAMEAMAEECPDVDIKAQTKIFRDHEFKDAKTDWPATWRNWMRTKQSRINEAKKPNQTQQPVESFRERDERLKREQVAKWAPKLSAGASSTQIDNFNTFDVEARDVTAIAGH